MNNFYRKILTPLFFLSTSLMTMETKTPIAIQKIPKSQKIAHDVLNQYEAREMTLEDKIADAQKHIKDYVLSLLTGFILGSLLIIWPWKIIAENELIESWYLPTLNISTFISIFLMLIGFYIVLKLESFSKDN